LSQGKNKRLLSYKKNHGTNLFKNTLLMNISKFIGGGDFFWQTMEICINEKQVANKRKIVLPFQVKIIFG
jgi:hypothetical protein